MVITLKKDANMLEYDLINYKSMDALYIHASILMIPINGHTCTNVDDSNQWPYLEFSSQSQASI
jgi:hypothetical protein